jgi:hypothetical protein
VYRLEKTYPVYDSDYADNLNLIRDYLEEFDNFQTVGRNGLHRYNNQDHAMLTGMLAVRNLVHGETNNLWVVNAEEDYHEEIPLDDWLLDENLSANEKAGSEMHPRPKPFPLSLSLGALAGLTLFTLSLIIWILSFRIG